jgi:hypothetical protein
MNLELLTPTGGSDRLYRFPQANVRSEHFLTSLELIRAVSLSVLL